MGRFVRNTPCPLCGSSDANSLYEDGSTYCWSCRKSRGGKRQPEVMSQYDWTGTMEQIAQLPTANMLARGLDAATAAHYGVRVEYDGSRNEVAYYFPLYKEGKLTGYQRRDAVAPGAGKASSKGIGDTRGADPFGSHVVSGRKFVIVTEGAEDAMAAWQMLKLRGKNYRVIATLGANRWKQMLPYLESFEKVMVCYDMDDAGRAAAEDLADALPHGRVAMCRWQGDYKDPNDLLIHQQQDRFFDAVMGARTYEPSGIISGDMVWELMQAYVTPEYISYPPEMMVLGSKAIGMREAEVSTWTAGSSAGKTSYIRRLKQHALQTQSSKGSLWGIGEVELEEAAEKTARGMVQFHVGKRWDMMTHEERERGVAETYGTKRLHMIDKGKRSAKKRSGGLMSRFKHLHYDKGCRLFFLDHITLGVREFGSGEGGLHDQDEMMEQFLDFVETTKSHLCLISHLRKPPGGTKSWSQGAVPTEEDMKGSGSLYQISFDIIGLSRNKQHDDDYERNVSQLHVLKCRETGDTGPADRMYWNQQSNRLEPAVEAELPPVTHEEHYE